jgi:cation:H+ antiporter
VTLLSVGVLLVWSASVIFVSAHPFAMALVQTGLKAGVDEFMLVQWVAPLASEAPEMVVAVLMVLRGAASTGLRALVSSNVNQWTLLVGTLAVVYSVASGGPAALPLDHRQRDEVLLTAAQCLFGIAVLADLRLALWQGAVIFALFVLQPIFPDAHLWFGIGYIVLFVGILTFDGDSRRGIAQSLRTFRDLLLNRKLG